MTVGQLERTMTAEEFRGWIVHDLLCAEEDEARQKANKPNVSHPVKDEDEGDC